MKKLVLHQTRSTPAIVLDPDLHVHAIRGESYPENTTKFYQPVFDWLGGYLPQVNGTEVVFDFEIVYFNSSSSKTLMDLFELLDDAAKAGKRVVVNWRYDRDNETAKECGEEFREDVAALRFNLVENG